MNIHLPLFVFTLLHLICVVGVLLICLAVALCCYCRRRKRKTVVMPDFV